MIKVLITGANGLVGQTLLSRLVTVPVYLALGTSLSDCRIPGTERGTEFA
jgi:nucleoside-diphosphate-sugar epimerase